MKLFEKDGAVLLHVKVVPNSSRTALAGTLGDALKIKIAQPPESGKANRALLAYLAELLEIPPSNLSITSGESQPRKTLRITGLSPAAILQKLQPAT
ncbi:MAG TPA: DUF167 domain-containing protein [Phycisphaerae bacterium]|jgi:uncharacterized protein (TIGR00251 family)|nr:DUF167 domain-containing protein [Phycisphaerae bacterium]